MITAPRDGSNGSSNSNQGTNNDMSNEIGMINELDHLFIFQISSFWLIIFQISGNLLYWSLKPITYQYFADFFISTNNQLTFTAFFILFFSIISRVFGSTDETFLVPNGASM